MGAKDYTVQEEREMELIERNLTFSSEDSTWTVEYPWIKDPNDLPDNRKVAMAKLAATERRLRKNADHTKVYDEQINDVMARNVARKLSKEELTNYTGPMHYIAHHEVLKPESKSTPVCIVFNSSANYMGHVLNEYWAKGPDLLNNLLRVLIRELSQDIYRQRKAIVKGGFQVKEWIFSGDISKQEETIMVQKPHTSTEKILEIKWSPCEDQLCFEVKIKFSPKRKITALQTNNTTTEIPPQQLTKRMILSQINSVYDPPGRTSWTVHCKSENSNAALVGK